MLDSLEQVKRALASALDNNPSLFSLINTRVMLRTGVDLGQIKPTDNRNPAAVTKVVGALNAMGYSIEKAKGA